MTIEEREKQELEFVRVGQHSRHTARAPMHVQAQTLRQRHDDLWKRKLEIESLLAQHKNKMLAEKGKIIGGRYQFSQSKERYEAIATEERQNTVPLKRELNEIEKELVEVKRGLDIKPDREIIAEARRKESATQEAILNCLQQIKAMLESHLSNTNKPS